MRFSLVALASTLAVANAIPFDIVNILYKREDSSDSALSWLSSLLNTTNSTNSSVASNSTNTTSSEEESDLTTIKIFSFSSNFTEIYGSVNATAEASNATYSNSSTISIEATVDDILSILNIAGNSSSVEFVASALGNNSLSALLNATDLSSYVSLDYEELATSFNDSTLPLLYQALEDDSEDYDAFVILLEPVYLESAAFFVDITANISNAIVFAPELTAENLLSGGLLDLYNAIVVAADEDNVFDTEVVSSQYISPAFYSQRVGDRFVSSAVTLGKVTRGEAQWFVTDASFPDFGSNFTITEDSTVPEVLVVETVGSSSADLLAALQATLIDGIVLSAGSIDDYSAAFIEQASILAESIPVVFASSSELDVLTPEDVPVEAAFAAGLLSPVKAKVLLQAALASDLDNEAISELFAVAYGG